MLPAEVFLGECQKRGLPDASGDHHQVPGWLWQKAVAERAPNVESLARAEFLKTAGELSLREIDHVNAVSDDVVHGERAADERVVQVGQADHQKLARENAAGDFRAAEADA